MSGAAEDVERLNEDGLADFSQRSEEEAPVAMLNLLAFEPDGGRERYEQYGEAVAPLLTGVGGRVLYAGRPAPAMIGAESWDLVVLVEYPSRAAFLEMIGSPAYQEIAHLRTEALRRGELHPIDPLDGEFPGVSGAGSAGSAAGVNYRALGDSGIEVSEISLGSWLTYSGGVEREHTEACTRRAFELGITLFDTANIYGRGTAEEAWGEILADFDRDSYVLATKVFFPMSASDRGLSAEQIRKQLDASLKRLRTDYVDLYQCHRFDTDTPIEETMEALTDAVESGKARHIGFSEWTPEQISAALEVEGAAKFVSSQPQYNMIWRAPEAEVFPLCAENGISQIVWSPLAQGVLTGKYRPGEPPPADSRAASGEMGGFIARYMDDDVLEAVQPLVAIAEDAGLTTVQLALAWILRRDEVASAIVGATSPEQVDQNAAASGVELSEEVLDAIDEALGDVVIEGPRLAGNAREGVRHR